jgi:signal transduction histidine kinase
MAGEDLAALERRMRELESELNAARRAIMALTEKLAEGGRLGDPTSGEFRAAWSVAGALSVAPSPAEEAARAAGSPAAGALRPATAEETESELRRQNAELDRVNRLRSEFISIAAHEFRTPMTSIVGYLDLISQGRLGSIPEAMQRPIASLNRNTQRLKRLIDEMLDVSRLDSGRMVLHRDARDLCELARSAVTELESFTHAKRHDVGTAFAEVPPVDVDGDKIHQVITNLLANAIKYTPEGGCIALSVGREEEWAVLRVRDNGIGIPAGLREKIFEPFSEITAPQFHTSAGPDSAGLGLYIARGIVLLHGGQIAVDSSEGEFTEFTVRLPLCATAPTPGAPTAGA